MTKSEGISKLECRSPKITRRASLNSVFFFGFRHSGFFRHFVIRHLKVSLLLHRVRQSPKICLAADGDATELQGDRGEHLDVQQCEFVLAQVLDQMEQRYFRGVADAVEHRFAGKKTADGYAIDTAHQPL